jgi:1,2-diacylglycerol 3-alpha-glucosyltransferase
VHVLFFADQHLDSLGGAQVSMRLQRKYLERAGHTVTVVAPAMHGPRARAGGAGDDIDLPSVPITPDREYAFTWPGRRTDRWLDRALGDRALGDRALRGRGAVDLVHVQADFWGAFIGHRFAARHGVPVVHTMHNRVDVGIEATAPAPRLVLRGLNAWQRRALRDAGVAASAGVDGWAYLRRFAERSAAVTAPSGHFARRLEQHGVFPRVDVVWNGIDDDILDAALAARTPRIPGPPRLIWLGRMSPEKRLLPFLDALADSGVRADVEVVGGGAQLAAARRLVARRRPAASVTFAGRLSYPETLRRIAAADAVVQTSIGFETQGMTPFEAAALGTPAIISDPDIGRELGSGFWSVRDASTAALADAVRAAVADIAAATPVTPDPAVADRFRQSSRTAAMLDVYDSALRL